MLPQIEVQPPKHSFQLGKETTWQGLYLLQGWGGRALLGVAVRLPGDAMLALEVGYRVEQLGCVQIAPSDHRAPGGMDRNHLDKRLLRRQNGEKKKNKKHPTSKARRVTRERSGVYVFIMYSHLAYLHRGLLLG